MRWIELHCRNWFLSNNYCTSLPVYLNWSFILHFDLISVLLVLVNIHLVSSIGYFNDGLKQVYVLGDECDKQKKIMNISACFALARHVITDWFFGGSDISCQYWQILPQANFSCHRRFISTMNMKIISIKMYNMEILDGVCALEHALRAIKTNYCQITRFLLHFIGNYCCNWRI